MFISEGKNGEPYNLSCCIFFVGGSWKQVAFTISVSWVLRPFCVCWLGMKKRWISYPSLPNTLWELIMGFLVVSFSSGGHDAIWLTKRLGSSNLCNFNSWQTTVCDVHCAHVFLFWGCFLQTQKIAKAKFSIYIYVYIYTLHTCFFWRIHENINKRRHTPTTKTKTSPGISWTRARIPATSWRILGWDRSSQAGYGPSTY